MTLLNIFLAVVGLGVTVMVILGMLFLKPHHITQEAELTDLSDVKNRYPPVDIIATPSADLAVEPAVGQVT
jgi:hypothetical protein